MTAPTVKVAGLMAATSIILALNLAGEPGRTDRQCREAKPAFPNSKRAKVKAARKQRRKSK